MTDQEILDSLSRILGALLGDESILLAPETTRPDIPGWDSFLNINFIVATEEKFGIKFHLADVEAFVTVGDVIQEIKHLKGW